MPSHLDGPASGGGLVQDPGTVFESTAAPGGNNALYLHLTSQGGAFVAGNEIAAFSLADLSFTLQNPAEAHDPQTGSERAFSLPDLSFTLQNTASELIPENEF
ncbi:hypothetical protein T484DRAFT_1866626 [Baffinella frigidus]|nr:hypothetical protein T484DRAFT_1866626 [Cryptophyta sp. CCMP2293]